MSTADRVNKPPPESTADVGGDIASPAPINQSLHDVLDLLTKQVEQLQVSLEFHRLTSNDEPDVTRWYVNEIDRRQDRIDEVTQMILASGDSYLH